MEQQKQKEEASQVHQGSCESASKLNPTAAKVLREAIRGDDEEGKKGESKEGSSADDVLVYDRTLRTTIKRKERRRFNQSARTGRPISINSQSNFLCWH